MRRHTLTPLVVLTLICLGMLLACWIWQYPEVLHKLAVKPPQEAL